MPPKSKLPQVAEAPPEPKAKEEEALRATAAQLERHFEDLKTAVSRGEGNLTQSNVPGRPWQVAVSPDAATGADSVAKAGDGPAQYAEWVRRFGFSVEREIQLGAEHVATKTQHQATASRAAAAAAKARPVYGTRHGGSRRGGAGPAMPQHLQDPSACDIAKRPQQHPLPSKPAAPFVYSTVRDQQDLVRAMEIDAARAGDGFQLTRSTDYDDVDRHALIRVGAWSSTVLGDSAGDTPRTLDGLVAALVKPYLTSSWKLSAFDAAQFKVRAICRWISAFVRVVPPPLGPPLVPVPTPDVTSAVKSPSGRANAGESPSKAGVSIALPTGGTAKVRPSVTSPALWKPYRVEDDVDAGANADELLPTLRPESGTPGAGEVPGSGAEPFAHLRGHATATAVFATRNGDPHQVATLFSYMCRHPAAKLVFPTQRAANAAMSGHHPLETDAEESSYSALTSDRPTVAGPTGVAKTCLGEALSTLPRDTLSHAAKGIEPCSVVTVRGTLKGTVDSAGKPTAYLPWSWNVVTLPDGKQYLIDVALCAADVSIPFLLAHQAARNAVLAGEMPPGGEPAPPPPSTKEGREKPGKGDKAAQPPPPPPPMGPAETITSALLSTYGAYAPLAGTLQFHAKQDLDASKAEGRAAPITTTDGTRAYVGAPILVHGASAYSPAVAATAAACAQMGLPQAHAIGVWTEQPLAGPGPHPLPTLATLLPRTCFDPAYFFSDPIHFAALHYPDDPSQLLLKAPTAAPPPPPLDSSNAGGSTSSRGRRLLSKAQWETAPRLSASAIENGLALESHARRGHFVIKACPLYLSFILGNAPTTELQVEVYKGHVGAVMQNGAASSLAPLPAPQAPVPAADGTATTVVSSQAGAPGTTYRALVDSTLAAKERATKASMPVMKFDPVAGTLNATPTPALIDRDYFALSREESMGRAIASIMFPDVGPYTILVGTRRIDTAGNPCSAGFQLAVAYQCTVSYVPTHEALMPPIREPATVAKLSAPATSRIAAGTLPISITPTMPRVVGAVVVNTIAPEKRRKTVRQTGDGTLPPPVPPETDAAGTSPGATGAAATTTTTTEAIYFLPWDPSQAAFSGTCKVARGTLDLWIVLQAEPPGQGEEGAESDAATASTVPPHLLPTISQRSVGVLLSSLFRDEEDGGRMPMPTVTTPTGTTEDQLSPGVEGSTESATQPISRAAYDLLGKFYAASGTSAAADRPMFSAQQLATAWAPASPSGGPPAADAADTKVKGSPAKGGAKAKPKLAPTSPTPDMLAREKKVARFDHLVPFVLGIPVLRRMPSKDAALLTNNFSQGATEAPTTEEALSLPPTLYYMPSRTAAEVRLTHGVLAQTIDEESAAIAGEKKTAVGGAFSES